MRAGGMKMQHFAYRLAPPRINEEHWGVELIAYFVTLASHIAVSHTTNRCLLIEVGVVHLWRQHTDLHADYC